MGSDCFANKRSKSRHCLFVDDETIVDSAASQSTPCDDGVGSRQPDATIIPLASFQQGYEPPNTGNSIDHDVTEVLRAAGMPKKYWNILPNLRCGGRSAFCRR